MRKTGMALRMIGKSIQFRKAQVATIIAAILVGASLMTVLVGISMDISEKIRKELEVYGPNIFVEPRSSYGEEDYGVGGERLWNAYLNEGDMGRIQELPSARYITGYVPYLYEAVEVEGRGGRPSSVAGSTR